MTIKLNDLAKTTRLAALPGTFGAVKAFCDEMSQKEGPTITVGTLVAALTAGTSEFVSPVLPRGLRRNTAEEVRAPPHHAAVLSRAPGGAGGARRRGQRCPRGHHGKGGGGHVAAPPGFGGAGLLACVGHRLRLFEGRRPRR